ncbi:hypothetical protein Aru02nite_19680 [Actinocatenispora rupis]|uniref:cAMP-binding domain of CRP or a regulatory subunit of cAMP-dependent protein kinases n=1 Tax=Actinocatenispora rupis TaxID=519421 RepID=A0A8J3J6P5_9ACTN|nr:hypothetical protein Aru02nite_19680 [Actinocatenispora rupis]
MTYPAGGVLCRAGEPATDLPVLLAGRVAASAATASGRVLRFGEYAAPCALDKVAVTDGGGHTATLTAVGPCRVYRLPRARFLDLVDDHAPLRRHLLRKLADTARDERRRWLTAGVPAQARLAGWLLDRAADDDVVRLPGGRQDLADLLGVTRVTVSRELSRLRRAGLIAVDGRTVHLLAPELLALRAVSAG